MLTHALPNAHPVYVAFNCNLQLPESEDGMVAYEEVLPSSLQYMLDLMKDEIVMNGILQSEDNLQGLLLSHFKVRDIFILLAF